eukprot:3898643-Prymnesium_polylepis.2
MSSASKVRQSGRRHSAALEQGVFHQKGHVTRHPPTWCSCTQLLGRDHRPACDAARTVYNPYVHSVKNAARKSCRCRVSANRTVGCSSLYSTAVTPVGAAEVQRH